jgi:hypothetical protein
MITNFFFNKEQETNPIERFSNWKNNKTNLIGCLNTQQGFSQFENHLKDEFSQLNLNFLVEVCQYKKIVMKALDLSSKDHEVDCKYGHYFLIFFFRVFS